MDNDKLPTPVNSASNKQPESISLSKFRDEYVVYVKKFKAKRYIKSIEYSFTRLIDFTGDVYLIQLTSKLLDNFITVIYSCSKSLDSLHYRTLKQHLLNQYFGSIFRIILLIKLNLLKW